MREPHHVPSDAENATTADGKAEDAPTANAKSWRESAGRDSAPDGYISGDLTRGMAVRLRGGPKTTEEHAAEASPRLMRLTRLTEHATEEPPRTAVDISPPRDARQEGGVKLDPATGKFTMDNVPPEMRAVLEEIESSRRSRAPEMRAVLEEMEKTTSAKEVGSSSAGDGSDGEVVVGGGVEGGGKSEIDGPGHGSGDPCQGGKGEGEGARCKPNPIPNGKYQSQTVNTAVSTSRGWHSSVPASWLSTASSTPSFTALAHRNSASSALPRPSLPATSPKVTRL
jgi:hypothetical protein